MGVDWLSCNRCGHNFPDCGDYVNCECGIDWCSDDCAEVEGYKREEDGFKPKGSRWTQETSCQFCREENYDDNTLLYFAMEKLGLDRDGLIKLYKESK